MASEYYQNLTDAVLRENSFGPFAKGPDGGRFDFTLLFEQIIMAIVPAVLLLSAVPFRTRFLLTRNRKVGGNRRAMMKLSAYLVLGALQLATITLWAKIPTSLQVGRTSIAASSLNLIVLVALACLSHIEHHRSVRPSDVICVYLLFAVAFDAVQCRTLWLFGAGQTLAVVFTAMLTAKTIVLVLEAYEKRGILLGKYRDTDPESTSGLINRGLFWWVSHLLIKGFKSSLSLSLLYRLDENLLSVPLLSQGRRFWEKKRSTGKNALLWSVLSSLKAPLALAIFPRLCLMGFKFSQPFLVKRVVTYINERSNNRSKDEGYGLIAAAGLVYAGSALATGFYQHKLFRAITMVRGTVISLILSQSLKLDSSAAVGSSALTYITADIEMIGTAFNSLHEIWANTIEVGIAIWLLQIQLGIGCVGPVVVVVGCTFLMSQLSRFMGPAIRDWNAAIQERVTTTATILTCMKETKMLGATGNWMAAIDTLRVRELVYSAQYRLLVTYMNLLGNSPEKLAPVFTFGISLISAKYGIDPRFDTATAFASLTIMSLIVEPLASLLAAVPTFVSSLGCFARVQNFLQEDYSRPNITEYSNERFYRHANNTGDGVELDQFQAGRNLCNPIIIRNVSFRIRQTDEPIIKNIDMRIEPQSLTVLTGRVGCGKTTLLRGLLGEVYGEGELLVPSSGIAYCSQTAWLRNSTVRENILGQSEMEESWYDAVVTACALNRDFTLLPAGDLTTIGNNGIALSGGQKQRISLARAVYARKPLLVIDDILSGLDWSTRNRIWQQVLGPNGVLKKQRATVILVSHNLNFLEDCDGVILLDDNGRIAAQGSFGTLKNAPNVKNLLHVQNQSLAHGIEVIEPDENITTSSTPFQPDSSPGGHEEGTRVDQTGDISLYTYYFKSIGLRLGLMALALQAIAAVLDVLPNIWVRLWTDANKTRSNTDTGQYFGLFVMISVLGLVIIGVKIWWTFVKIIPKSAAYLHFILLQTVMRAPLSFFIKTDTGDLINRFSKDMTLVDRELPTDLHITASNFFRVIAQAVLVVLGASYLGALLPVFVVFLYCLQKFYLRTSRQLRLLDIQATAPLHTCLLETIDGLSTIRAFGWETATEKASLALLDNSQKPRYMLLCVQRWLTLVLDLFVAACAVVLVAFGILLPETTSAGAMALALTSLLGLSQSLAELISSWTKLETSLGAISRLKHFERNSPQEISPANRLDPPLDWPSHGNLQMKEVVARYTPNASPVLSQVSLEIRPGEKVALCGRTGSGKSSLLLTLLGLLELESGTITLDSVDISKVEQNILRGNVIVVPQEAILFPGTLRSNLTFSPGKAIPMTHSDEELIAALEQVDLWQAIALHGGLDSDVNDLSLSQGQKQLLCLARAVLRKSISALVILDEAMSSVDSYTEGVMVRVLAKEFLHHSMVSVVHRLNTVLDFDKVIVLDAGRIVEMGKPTELLKVPEGKFRALWDGRDG